jgi:cytoskeleton protein RodZ
MATEARSPGATEVAAQTASSTGAMLRSAREAAGLSLEQVAQQLKLAPRQVKALEDESFADLPGRTFSRGFVRNYARLLNLDAQDLLAHLPDVAHAPALESPALHATGSMMAELPSAATSRTGAGRWLIPVALAACIIAAAAYEFYRGGLGSSRETPRASRDVMPQTAAPAADEQSVTTLPNPLAADKTDTPAAAGAMAVPDAPAGSVSAASAAVDAPLVLSFEGPSWTEIRDASGQLIVSRMIAAHSVEPVRGVTPFDVMLGNAAAVTLTYRGKPVDLAPYTQQNVARLTLK